MTSGVYLLRDPISGIVRYVGKSVNVERRISQHWVSRSTPSRLSSWLLELDLQGMRPRVDIIRVPVDHLEKVESFYIDQYWENSFNGKSGDGGFREGVITGTISKEGRFYKVRDYWIDKIKSRLIRRGVPPWRVHSSINGGLALEILGRAARYALRVLQEGKETKETYKGCWLHRGMYLEFPKIENKPLANLP